MSESHDALKNLVFISLPPSMERDINDFHIDSSIKIPVQLPDGKSSLDSNSEISLELIVAGMLKIIAFNPEHPHFAYYRDFVLAIQPDAVEELNIAAIAQEQKEHFAFAEELFLAVCHLAPQSATYINLATLYNKRAALDTDKGPAYDMFQQKALEVLKEGLKQLDDDEALLCEIGFFHLYQGDVELAKEYFDRYLPAAKDPQKKAHVMKMLSDINAKLSDDQTLMQAYDAIQMNKEEQAIASLDAYLLDNPKVWNAWFLKGWAYRRLGQFKEAEQALLSALNYSQGTSDIYNELALCSLEHGQRELAKTYLNTAVDLDDQNITLISNLAYLHLRDSEFDESRHWLEKARILDQNDPVIMQLMKDYQDLSGDMLFSPIVEQYMSTEDVLHQDKEVADDHH